MKHNTFIVKLLAIFISVYSYSQTSRAVITGAPFLRISPDARAGGLGDMGVATSPDAFSQYWNPAKFVFSENYSAVGLSYTPYLNSITNDIFLLNGSYFTYLDEELRSTIGASIYYFSLGDIQLSELVGGQVTENGIAKPNEFAIDVSYGLLLSDYSSMAVTIRYIRSDLFNGDDDANTDAANTFAVDVSGYYRGEEHDFRDIKGRFRAGFNIKNIGPKLSYTSDSDNGNFLPTNLGIGTGYDFLLDEENVVSVGLELNKLLVPTPEVDGVDSEAGVFDGIFNSFSDAPDGFSEELKEITYGVSVEYDYDNTFAGRLGYFYESEEKGARQYATVGLGFKFDAFGLDASYIIPTNDINNALENTLRFALTWDVGGDVNNK